MRTDSRKPIRLLTLVPYPLNTAPGQRYRIEQWASYLNEEGIEVHFETFAGAALSRVLYHPGHYALKAWHTVQAWLRMARSVWRGADFDAVYLYREAALIGPAWLERLAQRRNACLIYDFDDAVWLHYVSPSNRHLSYLKVPGKTRAICRLAAAVTVGNEMLAEYARQYNPRVTVVPSTVSLREYRPRLQRCGGDPPVIGWTGSHSSARYLPLVERALQTLARTEHFRLLVVGLADYKLDGVTLEHRPWRAATEVADLWAMDVGIMPLSDDPWARGKCAMKAIQYMGVGIPAVVSPVGANRTVVEDGVTGFHASSIDQWVAALGRLLRDQELRSRMGVAARSRVEGEYSAEVQAPRVGALLRSLQP